MSIIGKSLHKLLITASAVTDIVDVRISPSRIPQTEDFPAISYQELTNQPTNQKDGVSGFDKVDFDITLWSNSYEQISDLEEAVRGALDRKSISTEGATIDTIVFVRSIDDFSDPPEIFKKTVQFRFIVIR